MSQMNRNPNVDYSLLDFCSKVKVTDLPAISLLRQVQFAEIGKGKKAPQGKYLFAARDSYLIDWSLLN